MPKASMNTSLFEIFKIGIGPSSSHTMGPMRAAADFAATLRSKDVLSTTNRIQVELFGSLALTGRGHGTDRAVILGLCGNVPESIDPETVERRLARVREHRALPLCEGHTIEFVETRDLLFWSETTLPGHSNGMRFRAFNESGSQIHEQVYYSVGGGFIVRQGEEFQPRCFQPVPYPFVSAAQLLEQADDNRLAIWQLILENEKANHSQREVYEYVALIWRTMRNCVMRGLHAEGILPGGLNVRRRAPGLARRLEREGSSDPLNAMDWVNVFAMAVNEENAAGGRVVTAPTNGAAGVIPAVAHYYDRFVSGADFKGIMRFFLTAAAIGILYKENASISGAEVGCQGEVGVACSMAAGGLTAALSGTNQQVEYAAEIGMEHNLGMTCDPIKGLVQIPCIERNAMGAVKAINACRIALRESGTHKVSLDQVIASMHQSGLDMQSRYKETSLGGLALNVIEC